MNIKYIKAENPRKPVTKELGFGIHFANYMFTMDYIEGKGWINPTICPYAPIALDPSAMVFHYAQEIFEGLKAYRTDDGRVLMFRPDCNAERMNRSADRLCMPEIDEKDWVEAVTALVSKEKEWVPHEPGTSLYIRPFMIATDPFIGVRASSTYKFIVILSPVGSYYAEGLNPVKIYIEEQYTRASKGGTGFTKCGGNYAASIIAQNNAKKLHYTQVLWLDSAEHKYIEEVGTMNVFFKIDGKVITPSLEGSILPGITRRSVIDLLRGRGIEVEERKLSLSEVIEAGDSGKLEEIFGTGTAAVISPVGELYAGGKSYTIGGGRIGELSQSLYDELTGIQWGKLPDTKGWTVEVK